MRYKYIILIVLFGATISSCKKMIQINPPKNQLTSEKIFDNDATVNGAIINLYTGLANIDGNIISQVGLYTDELDYQSIDPGTLEFVNSILSTSNTNVSNIWKSFYSIIYQCNSVIEGLQSSTHGVTDSVRKSGIAEAKFLRAYCYFNLVNFYGDVPLLTTTDVNYTATAPRATTASIYEQMISDLGDAESDLSAYYPGGEKVRANKWAASFLLSKAYLYNKDWANAEKKSSAVINSIYNLASLNNIFIKNSPEAIWQLWNQNGFSNLGVQFITSSGVPSYCISNSLLSSFEPGDQRKINWVAQTTVSGNNYYYPYKYKNKSTTTGNTGEYTMYFRLGEEYLIRAEARMQLKDISGAISDLNIIRSRAMLPNIAFTISQDSCLTLIEKERRSELFAESANRFFDLKRTGRIDQVLNVIKPNWRSESKLYPIPQSEIKVNPNLTQNPGY